MIRNGVAIGLLAAAASVTVAVRGSGDAWRRL